MNHKIYILISFFIWSCESKETSLLLNIDSPKEEVADKIYDLTLSSSSGNDLNQVTIYWNFTIFNTIQFVRIFEDGTRAADEPIYGLEIYEDTNENGEYNEGEPFTDTNSDNVWGWKYINSKTYNDMKAGEFRDYEFTLTLSDSIYIDTIQIYTLPLETVSNLSFSLETIYPNGIYDEGTEETFIDKLNGIWDEGEEFIDCGVLDGITICEGDDNWDNSLGNGVWDPGEALDDEFNGVWDEGEEFIDYPNPALQNRILQWINPPISIETIKIFRSRDALNLLELNYCDCALFSDPSFNSYTDAIMDTDSSIYSYYYRLQVENNQGDQRESLITNNFTAPYDPSGRIQLTEQNITGGEDPQTAREDYIIISWSMVSGTMLQYFYQYEIWRSLTENSSPYKIATITDASITNFQDRSVGSGTSWWYTVAIKNISGEVFHSNLVRGSSK